MTLSIERYEDAPRSSVPFRCTACRRIGVTAMPRPRCAGVAGEPHFPEPMERVPSSMRDQAVDLIVSVTAAPAAADTSQEQE